jgi:hypothetical protein
MSKECESNGAIERFYDNHLKPMFDELQKVCGTQKRWEHLLIAAFLAYGWMPTMLWRSRTPLLAKAVSRLVQHTAERPQDETAGRRSGANASGIYQQLGRWIVESALRVRPGAFSDMGIRASP